MRRSRLLGQSNGSVCYSVAGVFRIGTIPSRLPMPIGRHSSTRRMQAGLREIDDMIREMEDEILNPLDDALSVDEDLLQVKHQVGQVWGAMITCLQRPLWLRYPELGPK